ncbi:MAG: nucleotidyl transferase AbiEii/AbiGii toxin family protein [Bacilli bacterium]|nr:nucleotidyl transferase AbiEii/AbiGii toxin family protein [Bacilli bacterium]
MRINKDSLKARANNIAKELSISQNVVYDRFFFDAFLARLAASPYKDNFVLKGGLYLSSVLGVHSRSTIDMDFHIKSLLMEKENIMKVVADITKIDLGDGIVFQVLEAGDIMPEDIYGGFQVKVTAKLDNVRHTFGIDIATGDPIVPSDRNYDYRCLVTGEVLPIKAYSLESVIAEKLETVLAKQFANSRSKDYYDLYILRKTQRDNVVLDVLKEAFKETCKYRGFSIGKEEALNLIDGISKNTQINVRWLAYTKRNNYAKGLALEDVMAAIRDWAKEAV